jgi:UDP-glucose 4-epimerase
VSQSKHTGPRQRVLVVGGAGFIGQHAVAYLAGQGHDVHATHRPGSAPAPRAGVTWLPCNLETPGAAATWPDGCQTLIYLAQARSWRSFPGGVPEVMRVNIEAVAEAVQFAVKSGAKRFVFASTGSVYSATDRVAREEDPVDLEAARNFYAASKLAAEALLRPFGQLLSVVLLRLFVPYGPGQANDYLLPRLVQSVRDRKTITLSGADGVLTNPLAVSDLARVLNDCLNLDRSLTLNVAGPEVLSLRTIGATIGAVVGTAPVFEVKADQPTQIIAGDTSRLRAALGWAPTTTLRDGLEQCLLSGLVHRAA